MGSPVYQNKWYVPPEGVAKLNTDVAMGELGIVGIGAILWDSHGDVLMSLCDRWEGECSVVASEAMAVRRGLQVAMEAGFRNFIVETDNMVLYHSLRRKKHEASN
ncbi:putative 7.3 kDa protein in cox-rep intergenic region [Bienertia sinuspersici]